LAEERDRVIRDWRRLHNEELHNLYSSPNIIRMIKTRRMRWAGNLAGIGEKWNPYSSVTCTGIYVTEMKGSCSDD
jgi:hypothetical protein